MKFRKKPVVVEAITFPELVEYGMTHGANIVNGMPWSFQYQGKPITHENDQCYLIPTLEGTMKFTPDDMLITGVNGEIYPCKLDIFIKTYDLAEDDGQEEVHDDSAERQAGLEAEQEDYLAEQQGMAEANAQGEAEAAQE